MLWFLAGWLLLSNIAVAQQNCEAVHGTNITSCNQQYQSQCDQSIRYANTYCGRHAPSVEDRSKCRQYTQKRQQQCLTLASCRNRADAAFATCQRQRRSGQLCGNGACSANQVCLYGRRCEARGSTTCGQGGWATADAVCRPTQECISYKCYPKGYRKCGSSACPANQDCLDSRCYAKGTLPVTKPPVAKPPVAKPPQTNTSSAKPVRQKECVKYASGPGTITDLEGNAPCLQWK